MQKTVCAWKGRERVCTTPLFPGGHQSIFMPCTIGARKKEATGKATERARKKVGSVYTQLHSSTGDHQSIARKHNSTSTSCHRYMCRLSVVCAQLSPATALFSPSARWAQVSQYPRLRPHVAFWAHGKFRMRFVPGRVTHTTSPGSSGWAACSARKADEAVCGPLRNVLGSKSARMFF